MNKSIINTIVSQALSVTTARYTAGDRKVDAAKAGRSVIAEAHITRRRLAMSRFGMYCLLKKAAILDTSIEVKLEAMVNHLVDLQEQATIAEDSLNTFLGASWGWGAYHDPRLSAFSVKVDDIWVAYGDKESVKEAVVSIPPQEWMARGFWESLRWLIDNHRGAEVINRSEYFKADNLSQLFRIRGQLGWWSSFHAAAQKGFDFHEDRLHQAETEYKLSGGCNTHYVGEQQEKWEAAAKRLEKATEAKELMEDGDVLEFIDYLCRVFELAGRDVPEAGEYSEQIEKEKQLATMESAAAMAMAAATKMIDAAIASGRLAA